MRILRYTDQSVDEEYGWLHENTVGRINGSPFGEFIRQEANLPIENIRFLPPVIPGKIICIGWNYESHAREQNVKLPQVPLIFLKPVSSIIGNGACIVLPPQSKQVEYEAELAIVVGKQGRWIDPENVPEYIYGFTIGNDITARDLQLYDGQWTRSKGFDTFCPLGPWIETNLDASDAIIQSFVNGEMRQMASTRDMVFSISQIVVFVSSVMTIFPGDVILTGTPAGVGVLQDGDVLETRIEGIGSLKNCVIRDSSHQK
jgi:2-keto-4-pentenoate hydratase/2-oxohepta-3-ene-1,7-dioic acid hydratase in catechol pathway